MFSKSTVGYGQGRWAISDVLGDFAGSYAISGVSILPDGSSWVLNEDFSEFVPTHGAC